MDSLPASVSLQPTTSARRGNDGLALGLDGRIKFFHLFFHSGKPYLSFFSSYLYASVIHQALPMPYLYDCKIYNNVSLYNDVPDAVAVYTMSV